MALVTALRCSCGAPKSPGAENCLKCRGGTKLTKAQREEILARVKAGEKTYPLAAEFGVAHQAISYIARKSGLDLSSRKGNCVGRPKKARPCVECGAPVSFYAKRCIRCHGERVAVLNLGVLTRNLAGMRFGKLVALRPSPTRKDGYVEWFCKCDCGGDKLVTVGALTGGNVRSCGCLRGRPKGLKRKG